MSYTDEQGKTYTLSEPTGASCAGCAFEGEDITACSKAPDCTAEGTQYRVFVLVPEA